MISKGTAATITTNGDAWPSKLRSKRRSVKLKIISRHEIDGRTVVAKQFESIAQGIVQDLGGEARLTTVMKHLVEGFAGVAIHVQDINARLLLGEAIDITEHSQVISTLVRVASRIGINRIARDVSPDTLHDILRRQSP